MDRMVDESRSADDVSGGGFDPRVTHGRRHADRRPNAGELGRQEDVEGGVSELDAVTAIGFDLGDVFVEDHQRVNLLPTIQNEIRSRHLEKCEKYSPT